MYMYVFLYFQRCKLDQLVYAHCSISDCAVCWGTWIKVNGNTVGMAGGGGTNTVLAISRSNFSINDRYLKVNFLVPENLL